MSFSRSCFPRLGGFIRRCCGLSPRLRRPWRSSRPGWLFRLSLSVVPTVSPFRADRHLLPFGLPLTWHDLLSSAGTDLAGYSGSSSRNSVSTWQAAGFRPSRFTLFESSIHWSSSIPRQRPLSALSGAVAQNVGPAIPSSFAWLSRVVQKAESNVCEVARARIQTGRTLLPGPRMRSNRCLPRCRWDFKDSLTGNAEAVSPESP